MIHDINRQDVIVIVATLVVLLAAVGIPAIGRARQKAARISCTCNLKGMGLSFRIWANDSNGGYPMAFDAKDPGVREDALAGRMFRIFQVMSNELPDPRALVCPADTRAPAKDWNSLANSNVSYFVGLDAEDSKYNMLLAGDRNISRNGKLLTGTVALGTGSEVAWTSEIHHDAGNIALADGSVQQVTTGLLRKQLANSGDSTNRILFPQ